MGCKIARNIKAFFRNEDGAVMPFIVLVFPLIFGMIGLTTDAGLWMADKRKLQLAADTAAIAAAWEYAKGTESYMDSAALNEAVQNGYNQSANGSMALQMSSNENDETLVSVSLEQDATSYFSKMIFNKPVRISASAQAAVSGGSGEFCVLSLEEEDPGAFSAFGAVEVDAQDCGIYINSDDRDALELTGNVDVNVSTVDIVGDHNIGGSVNFQYEAMRTGVSALEDPYADLEVPETSGCDENNYKTSRGGRLSPGTYCGGITISGNNTVEFEPGVYVIDGGNFKISGQGQVIGEGVTFILTGSGNDYAGLDVSGGREVTFSAPLAGEDWEGITFFQDRNAPADGNTNKIVGTSNIAFNGVAYFPSQPLWFGGASSVSGDEQFCTKLIARTVTLAGNPNMGNVCQDYGLEEDNADDTPTVRLVM